jgi:GNAT superfamily N-acetyltransferase
MQSFELSQLAIAPAETDADLEAMIHVRGLVTPEAHPTVEILRFNLESKDGLTYLVARAGEEPVACGFVEPWSLHAVGDIAVVAEHRRQGIGSAMLAEISERARRLGKGSIQGEVKESDVESRLFLERRGFVRVGGEQALVLELDTIEAPAFDSPAGVRIVSRLEEPDRLEEMYARRRLGRRGHSRLLGYADVRRVAGARDRQAGPPPGALFSSRSPVTRSSATPGCRSMATTSSTA